MVRRVKSAGRCFGTTPVSVTFLAGPSKGAAPLANVVAYPGQRLMEVAERHGLCVPTACGGGGDCASCLVRIDGGAESLQPMCDDEREVMDRLGRRAGADARLACRATLQGAIPVTVRFPAKCVARTA